MSVCKSFCLDDLPHDFLPDGLRDNALDIFR